MTEDQRKRQTVWGLLTSATPEQSRDTGLAMILICLLLAYFGQRPQFVPLALILLILAMVWPAIFRPLAGPWFGLSHLLGGVASKIILTVLFFGLVLPIGLIRRLLGADPLQLKKWKKATDSVFYNRQGPVQPQDLEKPY
ncbi:MAG: hypothetical protein A2Y80_06005 [Deltaproteobacteria bacterium RBG_13_58_19]|nr:MAG: hypothetical protein A2Y80_06005 [Deltaproteobacteria bacterium RBG_13_58_19]